MTDSDRIKVLDKLEWEGGYEYFITGSDFPEIEDKEFREAYDNLVDAWTTMEELLGEYPEDYVEEEE